MKKISSFEVDHNKLDIGMYISRVDDDIITYDIRMKKPNCGSYIDNGAAHTIEHLFATYARNSSYGDNVIYVGPMGCRTGFYLLTRGLSHENAISMVADGMRFIADFTGDVPGVSEVECGNYREHDLAGAIDTVKPMIAILSTYKPEMLEYSWHNN